MLYLHGFASQLMDLSEGNLSIFYKSQLANLFSLCLERTWLSLPSWLENKSVFSQREYSIFVSKAFAVQTSLKKIAPEQKQLMPFLRKWTETQENHGECFFQHS